MSSLKARMLARLREQMQRLEKPGIADRRALSLGPASIDDALPSGGLARGCLHEVSGPADDAAAYGFVASLLGRLTQAGGVALWCRRRRGDRGPYGPGLARFGLTPARLIVARARDTAEILWAMEEGLRSGRFAAVLGENIAPDLTATRRLQLAAEACGTTALLLSPPSEKTVNRLSAATTRWRIASVPAERPERPRMSLTLERCRGGGSGAWNVEWNHEALHFDLAAALVDRPMAAVS
jgi:protein ImuA